MDFLIFGTDLEICKVKHSETSWTTLESNFTSRWDRDGSKGDWGDSPVDSGFPCLGWWVTVLGIVGDIPGNAG